MDLRDHSLEWLAGMVASGQLGAHELIAHSLERIEALDPELHAFVAVDAERALASALALDERLAAGEPAGPLCGIPIAVKDTEDTVGYRTTYGSRLWDDQPIARRDSVLVARLKAAGAIVVGKTNTPELATKATTDNLLFGATGNPWDPTRTCGGSSGGSAAAVAAGMVPLATGSDGGGSIRIPAAACGLSGFKPSLGRVPDGGPDPADWHHFTTRGVLTFGARDAVWAYDAVVGPEPTDLRSLPSPDVTWRLAATDGSLPARIGWSPTLGYAEVDPTIVAACEAGLRLLTDAGVEIVEVPEVFDHDPGVEWGTLVSVWNRRTFAGREARFAERDPDLVAFDGLADAVTPAVMVAAEDACHRMNLRLVEIFSRVDLLACPTLARPAPHLGEASNWIRHTYPFNMTRSPAGTVTVGFAAGMPVGLQLVGPQHADVDVLCTLIAVEDLMALDRRPPAR